MDIINIYLDETESEVSLFCTNHMGCFNLPLE